MPLQQNVYFFTRSKCEQHTTTLYVQARLNAIAIYSIDN